MQGTVHIRRQRCGLFMSSETGCLVVSVTVMTIIFCRQVQTLLAIIPIRDDKNQLYAVKCERTLT